MHAELYTILAAYYSKVKVEEANDKVGSNIL